MIRLSEKLPRQIAVAVSGGCDSMAALDFLRRAHDVRVLHYNHGTAHGDEAQRVVSDYCNKHQIDWVCDVNIKDAPKGESLENFWRTQRYKFFKSARKHRPVITCHHLDDVVETWIFTSLNGNPHLIPSARDFYIRPFLETRSAVFEDWCDRKNVPYIEDPSNSDTRFMRNFIRHELMSKALVVNPGLHKVLRKKLKDALLE